MSSFYYGSRNPLADTPFTSSQSRQLLNYGIRSDVSTVKGRHNVKVGIDHKADAAAGKVCLWSYGQRTLSMQMPNPAYFLTI